MEGVHAGSRDPGDTGGWYRVRPSHNHPVTFQSTLMFSDSCNDRKTVSTGQSRVNICRVSVCVCVCGGEGRRGTFNILCQTDLCAVIEELPVAICHLDSLPVADRKAITFVVVQSPSPVQLFMTPWTAARQASLSLTISRSLPKFISNESVMPSNHPILCHPLLLLPITIAGP